MIWALAVVLLILAVAPVLAERLRHPMDAVARRKATGDFVELSRGLTYFQWHGPVRGPVIVCVHGLTTPSYVWLPLIRLLTPLGFRVLTYDLYGRGLSDRPRGAQDRAFFVGQLHELLESQAEVLPREGVTVMGYSMGGAIAAAFAADQPARVDRLVLIAPVAFGARLGRFMDFVRDVPVLGDIVMPVLGGVVLRRGINRSLSVDEAVPDLFDQMAGETRVRGSLPAILSSARNMMVEDLSPTHAKLGKTGLPVLAIWGEADRTIPLTGLGELARINREARQVSLPGVTHGLPYTHPAEVMPAMLEFLRER